MKLITQLQKQLQSTDPEVVSNANKCLLIYNYLKETEGRVWESKWDILTKVTDIIGKYPNSYAVYKPTHIGNMVLKRLKTKN